MKKNDSEVKSNKELFDFSGSRDKERLNEKDSNRKTPLRVKSNEEVFEIIQTHEILSESDCSEIKENKVKLLLSKWIYSTSIIKMEMIIAYLEQSAN